MRYGLCCIVLELQDRDPPRRFQKMTYSSFSSMEKEKAVEILGSRILNNLVVTLESIRFCNDRGYCYRLSSDLFPLVTYENAKVGIEDLPQIDLIDQTLNLIKSYISESQVRISTHPDQFNVLASENVEALDRTVRELNFQSWLMDRIGCPVDYSCPINLHINNNSGSRPEIVDRLLRGIDRLDENCRKRLVFENDDKPSCWSVKMLMDYYNTRTGCPITFDYLHHKCHPDGLSEEEAVSMCHSSWGAFTPLFHFSESKDEKNPRAHADYPSFMPSTYGLDFDIDFEFKMKDRAINAALGMTENSTEEREKASV